MHFFSSVHLKIPNKIGAVCALQVAANLCINLQVTREERLIVKPLYDRYRLVKQMLTRVSITPIIVRPSSFLNIIGNLLYSLILYLDFSYTFMYICALQ